MQLKLWLLLGALSGCSSGNAHFETREQVAVGQIGYAGPVLDQARRDFIGGANLGGISDAGEVTFATGIAVTISLARVQTNDLGRGLLLTTRIYGEHGELRSHLPEGLGVFTDPMRISITADTIGAEALYGKSLATRNGQVISYGVGAGIAQTLAQVTLNSTLIALKSHDSWAIPYVLVSGRYHPVRGPDFSADVHIFDIGRSEWRLGVTQRF